MVVDKCNESAIIRKPAMPEVDKSNHDLQWRRRLHFGRLARLKQQLARFDCDAGIFYDPINIRYATGTTNMQVYSLHNPCRYVFVAADGPVILFEFKGCEHLCADCPAVDEVRRAVSWYHFITGPRTSEMAKKWSSEIASLARAHGRGARRLAFDRLDPIGTHLIEAEGFEILDGQEIANLAKSVKLPEEIEAMREAIDVCQIGIRRMRDATKPGMTEQAIWSLLHQTNIEMGGEWIETRLLTSGQRTNPWYQEASARHVEDGDMICLDSDLIGPHGYSADISRSWLAGERRANGEQKRLHALAYEQVVRNTEIFKPGRGSIEIAQLAWRLPEPFDRYELPSIAHGIGLCNEFPLLLHKYCLPENLHDGVVEPGMVFCIESYAGAPGGREGVKLEQQILITESGCELLSDTDFEERLL
jgi:Xaa-Pro dipeptidase